MEVATGLNVWEVATARWVAAEPVWVRTATGGWVASRVQLQVRLDADLSRAAAVDLLTPDAVRLRSSVLGLALVDGRSGDSELIGSIRSGPSESAVPGEVLYVDAFDGFHADVRYRVTRDGFEQDVILREALTEDGVRSRGFDPATARFLVLTEFFEPPQPRLKARSVPSSTTPGLLDHELGFGQVQITAGRAFSLGGSGGDLAVAKSWECLEGRWFLVEAVSCRDLARLFAPSAEREHVAGGGAGGARAQEEEGGNAPVERGSPTPLWQLASLLPDREPREPRRVVRRDALPPIPTVLLAGTGAGAARAPVEATRRVPGVVIDYPAVIQDLAEEYVFRSDTTYYVSGPLRLRGRCVIEGGAVVKFTNAGPAMIVAEGPIECRTGPYWPAVFTGKDDDSAGEVIPGSEGSLAAGGYADPVLWVRETGQTLAHLRIRGARVGIAFDGPLTGTNQLRHLQFSRCGTVLAMGGAEERVTHVRLQNVLVDRCDRMVTGGGSVLGEQVTVHRMVQIGSRAGTVAAPVPLRVDWVNSLLVDAGEVGTAEVRMWTCATFAAAAEVFRSVGQGEFYLRAEACRNVGSAGVDARLAAELAGLTTYPPIRLTGVLGTERELAPQAGRDEDGLDLGYHYAPIDYLVDGLVLGEAVGLRLRPGTVVAWGAAGGVRLAARASLLAEGTREQPVRLLPAALVQEQPSRGHGDAGEACGIEAANDRLPAATAAPVIELRSSWLGALAGPFVHLRSEADWYRWVQVTLQDCTVQGGTLAVGGAPGSRLELRNSRFEGVNFGLQGGVDFAVAGNEWMNVRRTATGFGGIHPAWREVEPDDRRIGASPVESGRAASVDLLSAAVPSSGATKSLGIWIGRPVPEAVVP